MRATRMGSRFYRPELFVVAFLFFFTVAAASSVIASGSYLGVTPPPKPVGGTPYEGGGRVGGDTFADAVVMPNWIFTDTGNTCGYADNYEVACPYGSDSPDVVYRYDCTWDQVIAVDLCASSYDTKVFVYDGPSTQNLIACNDDAGCGYSGWQSHIEPVSMQAGHSYYFVVDGYNGQCGSYVFTTTDILPCIVDCDGSTQEEGEPPCQDGYVDQYNAGCQNPGGWTPIVGGEDGCAVMCGKACTFLYQGLNYRDSDWYTATASGGPVTISCIADFPLEFILIYGTDCANLQMLFDAAPACQLISHTWSFSAGQELWPWVGPSTFYGVPESNYVIHACGLLPPPPEEACCGVTGECILVTQEYCEANGGIWFGGPCVPNPCGATPILETSWGRLKTLGRP